MGKIPNGGQGFPYSIHLIVSATVLFDEFADRLRRNLLPGDSTIGRLEQT